VESIGFEMYGAVMFAGPTARVPLRMPAWFRAGSASR